MTIILSKISKANGGARHFQMSLHGWYMALIDVAFGLL